MSFEIERKFLVDKELWNREKHLCTKVKDIDQYYLLQDNGFILRVFR